uniref:Uncharacterized protein n=1 Tax=Arion vulgaris TaxID=1028688 RepID=A0A0B7B2I8_9EUPU
MALSLQAEMTCYLQKALHKAYKLYSSSNNPKDLNKRKMQCNHHYSGMHREKGAKNTY